MSLKNLLDKTPLSLEHGIYNYIEMKDAYVENYDKIAKDDLVQKIMPDEVKEVLLNCCQLTVRGDRVLDIGAAYGFIISQIKAKEKIALDISIDYLTQITDSSILRILCNAEEIPLESNSIDTIICTDVFEHVENEMNLVGEISRLLPVGGQLLLATPWEQDLSVYETEEYITKYKKYDFVHLRSVNDDLIKKCFPNFSMNSSTIINIGMKHMKLKPYPLKFMNMEKKY